MYGFSSSDSVVDKMVSELAELRHQTRTRRAAYLALVHAIVQDEVHPTTSFAAAPEREAAA